VRHCLLNVQLFVANEDGRKITGIPDTTKVSKLLSRWVEQGLLIKLNTSAKRNVKYCLPERSPLLDFLFTKGEGR